jgi:hypothetical protein
MSEEPNRSSTISPALVALAGWIIPGSGYLLLHQWARGLTIGITILALFFFGLLIGGVRCLDVPGYDAHGKKEFIWLEVSSDRTVARQGTSVPEPEDRERFTVEDVKWALTARPIDEIRAKPWSIAQIMFGPLDLLCDWWSIKVSPTDVASAASAGVRSHSRVNELGVLYTAVAGMLNLLAMIDSSHRAARSEEE